MHQYTQGHPKEPGSPRKKPRCRAHGRNIDGTSTEQRNIGTSEHRRNIDGTSDNLRTRPAPDLGRAGPRRHRKGPKATTTETEKYILRFRRNAPAPPGPRPLDLSRSPPDKSEVLPPSTALQPHMFSLQHASLLALHALWHVAMVSFSLHRLLKE